MKNDRRQPISTSNLYTYVHMTETHGTSTEAHKHIYYIQNNNDNKDNNNSECSFYKFSPK